MSVEFICGHSETLPDRDTVSSVGIYPRGNRHPYTSVNYATKHFRHALALDERRIRFRPQTWHEATVEHELQLDVDDPTFPDSLDDDDDGESDYRPPERTVADVKEVWFSGSPVRAFSFWKLLTVLQGVMQILAAVLIITVCETVCPSFPCAG